MQIVLSISCVATVYHFITEFITHSSFNLAILMWVSFSFFFFSPYGYLEVNIHSCLVLSYGKEKCDKGQSVSF